MRGMCCHNRSHACDGDRFLSVQAGSKHLRMAVAQSTGCFACVLVLLTSWLSSSSAAATADSNASGERLACGVAPDHARIASLIDRARGNSKALALSLEVHFSGLVVPRIEAGCEFVSMTNSAFELLRPQAPPTQADDSSPQVRATTACAADLCCHVRHRNVHALDTGMLQPVVCATNTDLHPNQHKITIALSVLRRCTCACTAFARCASRFLESKPVK